MQTVISYDPFFTLEKVHVNCKFGNWWMMSTLFDILLTFEYTSSCSLFPILFCTACRCLRKCFQYICWFNYNLFWSSLLDHADDIMRKTVTRNSRLQSGCYQREVASGVWLINTETLEESQKGMEVEMYWSFHGTYSEFCCSGACLRTATCAKST